MTRVHLRRRVHQYLKPEEWETVRHERHDLRDQAVLDSKNLQRQGTPGGIAGPAHVSCDRRGCRLAWVTTQRRRPNRSEPNPPSIHSLNIASRSAAVPGSG